MVSFGAMQTMLRVRDTWRLAPDLASIDRLKQRVLKAT
jgi:hypothetical protein